MTSERAQLADGQKVLELGCGWGSLSLFMAEKYKGSSFTAVSNSKSQKQYIDEQVRKRKLNNLRVITCDINDFEIPEKFDRIVSVEMFEHLRNYRKLFGLLSGMLKEDGKMFVHVFVHREYAYKFEVKDASDWMSRYFFTGGIMPSEQLFFHFNEDLTINQTWQVSGLHYSKTAEAWLKNMDEQKQTILNIFKKIYGNDEALKWFCYWRIFFLSCAELWSFAKGTEWYVCHYLFTKNKAAKN
jgi:cyclopropane-fatty-acyl-phospholipid synthase